MSHPLTDNLHLPQEEQQELEQEQQQQQEEEQHEDERTVKRQRLESDSVLVHLPDATDHDQDPVSSSSDNEPFLQEDLDDEDLVLSEVHIHPNNGRVDGRRMTSVFYVGTSLQHQQQDDDGTSEDAEDQEEASWDYAVEIEHAMGTTLGGVDWMVSIKNSLNQSVALELGAGTGLASIALSLLTDVSKVFCTDYGVEVLSNCERNIERNRWLGGNGKDDNQTFEPSDRRVVTRTYNWLMDDPMDSEEGPTERFNWRAQDISEWKSKGAYIFAADVVYDDSLTDALVGCLEKLLLEPLPEGHPRHATGRIAYLSMEKRFNFSLEELDVVAQAHDYFVKKAYQSKVLEARRIDCSSLPRCCDYERSKDLELYEVVLRDNAPPIRS